MAVNTRLEAKEPGPPTGQRRPPARQRHHQRRHPRTSPQASRGSREGQGPNQQGFASRAGAGQGCEEAGECPHQCGVKEAGRQTTGVGGEGGEEMEGNYGAEEGGWEVVGEGQGGGGLTVTDMGVGMGMGRRGGDDLS
jgi:hypothetical protein